MCVTRTSAVVAVTLVGLLRPLPAQQAPVALGTWVRVVVSGDRTVHQGRLALVLPDTVVLDDGRRVPEHVEYVALGSSGRVELPSRIRSHALTGAFVGLAIGMAIGHVSWVGAPMFSGGCLNCTHATGGQLIGHNERIVLGGLVGLGLGALVGAHVYTTRWDAVPREQVDRLRIGIVAQPGASVGIGVELAF